MDKRYIALFILLWAVILLGVVYAATYVSVVWLTIGTLFVLWGTSLHLHIQLKRRTAEEFKKYNYKFVESGNAITDTLKVAFDNIKKNNRSLGQIQAPMSELKVRVHRVEQAVQRLSSPATKGDATASQQQKTNQKNERRSNSKAS